MSFTNNLKKAVASKAHAASQRMTMPSVVPTSVDLTETESEPVARPAMARKSSTQLGGGEVIPLQASTSKNTPFASSPHGTPLYAPTIGFQVDKMEIPSKKKKQKTDQDDGTTTTPLAGTISGTPPKSSDDHARNLQSSVNMGTAKVEEQASVTLVHAHKCPVPYCDGHNTGFETQTEAVEHARDAHGYDGNPLAWCLANMRNVLALDEQGKPVPKLNLDRAPASMTKSTKPGERIEMDSKSLSMPGLKPGSPEGFGTSMKRTSSTIEGNGLGVVARALTDAAELHKIDVVDPWTLVVVSRDAIGLAYAGIDTFNSIPSDESVTGPPQNTKSRVSSDASSTAAIRVTLEDWEPFPDSRLIGEEDEIGQPKFTTIVDVRNGDPWEQIDWNSPTGAFAGLDDDGTAERALLLQNFWEKMDQGE